MKRYILNEEEIRLKKALEDKGYEFIDDGIHKPTIKANEIIHLPNSADNSQLERKLNALKIPYFKDTNNFLYPPTYFSLYR